MDQLADGSKPAMRVTHRRPGKSGNENENVVRSAIKLDVRPGGRPGDGRPGGPVMAVLPDRFGSMIRLASVAAAGPVPSGMKFVKVRKIGDRANSPGPAHSAHL